MKAPHDNEVVLVEAGRTNALPCGYVATSFYF
jgi:hypothetical protein